MVPLQAMEAMSFAGRVSSWSTKDPIKLPPDYAQFKGMSHVLDKYQLWRHIYSTHYYYYLQHHLLLLFKDHLMDNNGVAVIVLRHLAKYTVWNSCFLILKMWTYVQLSSYADINMKSKKKEKEKKQPKNTCIKLAYGILASQSIKVLQKNPICRSPAC